MMRGTPTGPLRLSDPPETELPETVTLTDW